MSADRSNELIDLLEMIVLQSGSELSENKNLPAHPDRHHKVIDYINRLNIRHAHVHAHVHACDMSDIANHRQLGAVLRSTRRRSSSTRAASSTRSSGWHRSARFEAIFALKW